MTSIEIVEVGPRDGLQNEPTPLSPARRIELISRLRSAGLRRIEAGAFVNPRRVPQMVGAEEVFAGLEAGDGCVYIGLVLNLKGAERAVQMESLAELNYVLPATDEFGMRNQGATTEQALAELAPIAEMAVSAQKKLTVTVAVSFGCPFSGRVPTERLVRIVSRICSVHPDEIAVADTIGCAIPSDVDERLTQLRGVTDTALRVHFHDTRRTGMANALAAMNSSVTTLDASVAGLGGCPFAPGSSGNIGTEDLVWLLESGGTATGVHLDQLIDVAGSVSTELDIEPRSGIGRAGPFP